MILTDLQRLLIGFTGCAAALILAGLAIDDRLRRRAATSGWTRAANRLAKTQHELRAIIEQHEHHLAHLAAEHERLRAQLATRPPSADHTVRLGPAAAGRTARLARVDPSMPLYTGGVIRNDSWRLNAADDGGQAVGGSAS